MNTIKEKHFTISISEDEYGNQNYICLGDNGDAQEVVSESDFTIFMDKLCKCMGRGDFVSQTFDSSEMFEKLLAAEETVDERVARVVERQREYMGIDTRVLIDTDIDISAFDKQLKEIDDEIKGLNIIAEKFNRFR
jgi:hypothetical protein